MEEIFNWIRPVLCGLAGGFVVWIMVSMTKEKSERQGYIRCLSYSKPFKMFSVLSALLATFVVYAVSKSFKGQEIAAFLVATAFVGGSVFLCYQAFFVRFSYDEHQMYYKSPIVGYKIAPWENLIDVGYSSLLQADYIVVNGIGKIWCSNMLNGYEELGEFLENKVQELFPDED